MLKASLKNWIRRPAQLLLLHGILLAVTVLLCLGLVLERTAETVSGSVGAMYSTAAYLRPPAQRDFPATDEGREAYRMAQEQFTSLRNGLWQSNGEEGALDLPGVTQIDRQTLALGEVTGASPLLARNADADLRAGEYDGVLNAAIFVVEVSEKSGLLNGGLTFRVTEAVSLQSGVPIPGTIHIADGSRDWFLMDENGYQSMSERLAFEDCVEAGKRYLMAGAYLSDRYGVASGEVTYAATLDIADFESLFERNGTVRLVEGAEGKTVYKMICAGRLPRDGEDRPIWEGNAIPVITELTVPLNEFWQTPMGQEWLDTTCRYVTSAQSSIPVIGTDNVTGIYYWLHGETSLTEGRTFTEEEYLTGHRVCLVSERLAEQNGWQVGDTVEIAMAPATYRANANVCSTAVWDSDRLETYPAERYEIIGFYRTPELVRGDPFYFSPNTVFVPNAVMPEGMKSEPDTYPNVTVSIDNESLDDFRSAAAGLGLEPYLMYLDQNYHAVSDSLGAIREAVQGVTRLAVGIWCLSVLAVLFLYVGLQRDQVRILGTLGCPRMWKWRYLLYPFALMTVVVTVLGGWLGAGLYDRVLRRILLSDGGELNDRFSVGGASTSAESVMVYFEQPGGAFWQIAAISGAILLAVGLLATLCWVLLTHGRRAGVRAFRGRGRT